jgi:hypothetical protein
VPREERLNEGNNHGNCPSGGRGAAGTASRRARNPARPRHVCRRHRRAAHHRPRAEAEPEQVAFLISADLFVCGIVTLIQSLGATQWFGIKLPVMMGVTFAAVGPMVAMANANPGVDGARMIFGAIIGAGIVGILIAPWSAACCASSRRWSPARSSSSSASR